jgi:hypothetical protein
VPISVITSGTQTLGATNGADVTLTLPTLSQGDVVYVAAGRANGGPTVNSSGWGSPVAEAQNGTHILRVWRKIMGSTPDTSVEIEGGGSAATATRAIYVALSGVDQTSPEDVTPTTANGSSTNPNAPAIVSVTDGAVILAFASSRVADTSITAPSGMSNGLSGSTSDTDASTIGRATFSQTTAGSYDPASWTGWNSGTWGAATIAVRPAPLPVEGAVSDTVTSTSTADGTRVAVGASTSAAAAAVAAAAQLQISAAATATSAAQASADGQRITFAAATAACLAAATAAGQRVARGALAQALVYATSAAAALVYAGAVSTSAAVTALASGRLFWDDTQPQEEAWVGEQAADEAWAPQATPGETWASGAQVDDDWTPQPPSSKNWS